MVSGATDNPRRLIAHIDMNSFFVSVERLKNPALKGRPVVVGGNPQGRSVVSSASYEARRFGIHSAMPMSRALRLCPELVIVPPGFSDYQASHDAVKALLGDFSPSLEMTSIDEGYLDLTGTDKLWGPAAEAGATIRRRIFAQTGLTASVGLSTNKLVSKVASDEAKPVGDPRLGDVTSAEKPSRRYLTSDGVLVVPPGEEAAFLAPLPVSHLPGCGPVTVKALKAEGVRTIGDLAALTEDQLLQRFGDHGRSLHQRARGIGSTRLGTSETRKSVSKERTFDIDQTDLRHLRSVLHRQCEEVSATLRRKDEVARTVTLKLRYPGFETHTHSRTLDRPINATEALFDAAADLLEANLAGRPVRLIGVGLSNLGRVPVQADLFAPPPAPQAARREATIDALRERFGKAAIVTGESVHLLNRDQGAGR